MASATTFTNRTRSTVRSFMNEWEAMQAANSEYTAMGGSSYLDSVDWASMDITKAEFMAVFTSIGNIQVLMDAGNATNLYTGAS